jgi:signal transduction histidine kinase
MKKACIASILFLFGQWLSAQNPSELTKLKQALKVARHDTTRAMANVDIANYFDDNTNSRDSVLFYAQKAENLVKKHPNFSKRVQVRNLVAYSHFKLSMFGKVDEKFKAFHAQKAKEYYQLTMSDAKRLHDENYYVKGWYNINQIHVQNENKYQFFKGSFKLANYLESKTQLNANDSLLLTKTYHYICTELEYEKNGALYQRYLDRFSKMVPDTTCDNDYLVLALLDQQVRKATKADEAKIIAQCQKIKQLFKKESNKTAVDFNLIEYYLQIGNYQKSLSLAKKISVSNYDSEDDNENTKNAYTAAKYKYIGKNLYMLNENTAAIKTLEHALTYMAVICEVCGLGNEKYEVLVYLDKAYRKQGDYKQAYTYAAQAEAIYKRQHDIQTQGLLAENDVQIEQIKQDKRVAQAETQALLKEQEAKIEKRQKYMVVGVLMLTLLVAVWAIYNYEKKKQLSQALENKNVIISQQAEDLSASNKLKDKIFALLSHDLRSPINRLVAALGVSVADHRIALMQELYNVQGVLNNVLYWSSMQIKGIKPHYTEIFLTLTIDSLLKEFEQVLNEKKLTAVNAIGREITIRSDENYLKIIVRNLLNNAVKFTQEGGFIHIDYQTAPNKKGMLIVKDTGVGIATDKIPTLFQYPISTVGTRTETGTGLGLSLCYEMTKQLGGNLQIFSKEGQGTKVMVELPV